MRSQLCSVASASTIMIATSSLPFFVGDDATGDDEVEDGLLELLVRSGTRPTASPIRARRMPPIGPQNGRPEICVDADAALIARAS